MSDLNIHKGRDSDANLNHFETERASKQETFTEKLSLTWSQVILINENSNPKQFKRIVKLPVKEQEREEHMELASVEKPPVIDLDLFNNDLSVIRWEKQNESTASISCKGSEMKVMKMLGHISAKRVEQELQ